MYVRYIQSPEEREHHVSFKQGLAQGLKDCHEVDHTQSELGIIEKNHYEINVQRVRSIGLIPE